MFELLFTKVIAADAQLQAIQGVYPRNLGVKDIANLFTFVSTSYDKIYSIITMVAGTLAICVILYGGIKYLMAGGDAKKAGEAKDALSKAVIGIIIITTTYGIITLGKAVGSMLNKTVSNSAAPIPAPAANTPDPDEQEYIDAGISGAIDGLPNSSSTNPASPVSSSSPSSNILNTGQGPVLSPTPNPTPTPEPIAPWRQYSQPDPINISTDL